MKKKILLSVLISVPLASSALTLNEIFRFKIPNPSLITNDWDGDGIPNNEDTDDDNDGIDDTVDDDQFSGRPVLGGASTTPNSNCLYEYPNNYVRYSLNQGLYYYIYNGNVIGSSSNESYYGGNNIYSVGDYVSDPDAVNDYYICVE